MNEATKKRIKGLSFGDPVTNVCAGDGNPHRLSAFVKIKTTRHKRCGITHTEKLVVCTDGKGKFWDTKPEVMFSGHLDIDESKRLYKPIWEAEFGKKKP